MEPSTRLTAREEPEEPSVGSITYCSGNSHSRMRVYSFWTESALSIIIETQAHWKQPSLFIQISENYTTFTMNHQGFKSQFYRLSFLGFDESTEARRQFKSLKSNLLWSNPNRKTSFPLKPLSEVGFWNFSRTLSAKKMKKKKKKCTCTWFSGSKNKVKI